MRLMFFQHSKYLLRRGILGSGRCLAGQRCYTIENASNADVSNNVDVIISGGGMVGAAMACALGQEDMLEDKKIVFLESMAKKPLKELPETYDVRVCSLSRATASFLNRLGAWDEIVGMRAQPVTQMQVWDSCSDARIYLNRENISSEIAYIVENDVILTALTQCLDKLGSRIDSRYQCKATHYDLGKSTGEGRPYITVHLDSGQSLRTKLLIGADGSGSVVRQSAGFHVVEWDYNQTAIVATLHISETENTIAWQRFLPTGPIALLPLTNTQSSLVWSVKAEDAKNLMYMSDEEFVDAVNDAFWHERHRNALAIQIGSAYNTVLRNLCPGNHFGRQLPPTILSVQAGSRARFPLGMMHSSQYVTHRLALIGDAAHRVHPLAGQGVNLGFGDVMELSRVLVDSIHKGSDLGNLNDLLTYETARQRHNLPVMCTIEALHRLYSTHLTPIVVARSLGLQTTNAFTSLKNNIINQATDS